MEEARILEWVTIPYPRRSSDPGIEPTSPVPPALASRFFTIVHLGSPNPYPFVLASVQFSPSVVSDCLFSHRLQHARPPCPSTTSGVYSNSCPLSQWCQPTISSSVVPFSSCLQSFPTSGSFQMSWFFASSDQTIGVSASASVLPMNIQDWFPLGLTGWISLQSKGL